MILIVGATGQLGTAVVRRLAAGESGRAGERVRAFVRPTSDTRHIGIPNVELAYGDLRNAASVDAACAGVDVIIATANTVAPRSRYSFARDEGDGYRNLIAGAERNNVGQFIFMSVPVLTHDDAIPTFRHKRLVERRLVASKVPYTIFRGSLFMDDWFALIGSSIPLRGAQAATLERPFWFSRAFMKGVGHMIEERGVALVPGSGATRHSFIALDDVATFIVKAVRRQGALSKIYEIGGPEALSWSQVVALFEKVLGRRVRAIYAPAALFRLQQLLLSPFSPAAGNMMGMNWAVGTQDTVCDTAAASEFGVTLTTSEQFLRDKASLPP